MIKSIKGIVTETGHSDNCSFVVLEVGGIGFELKTSFPAAAALPYAGETAKLFSYLYVREDALELYGFIDSDELNAFTKLIAISGVGPKAALAILSALTPAQLVSAVEQGEAVLITRAKGVGAKLAQRIILELKGKLSGKTNNTPYNAAVPDQPVDAAAALTALGYSQSEASFALRTVDTSLPMEDQVKAALQILFKTKRI